MKPYMLRALVLLFLPVGVCLAQTPATASEQLKSLTANYEVQRTNLTSMSEAQVKAPRDRYLADLTAAQKAAVAATRTTDLAAISAEMDAIQKSALPENAPPDLPKTLLQDRRALVSAQSAATRTLVPKKRDLASAYLRSLVALEESARRAKDQTTIDAIATEKQRAIAEVEGSGGGEKNRNVVDNGDFSRGPESGIPESWARAHQWKDVPDCTIVTEGREKFLRFRRLQAIEQADIKPEKTLPIPARARSAEVSFRMRVEGLVKGTKYDFWPGVRLSARDARDEKLAQTDAVMKENSSWKRLTARVDLPKGTTALSVIVGPFLSAGIVDFDDVVVEFR